MPPRSDQRAPNVAVKLPDAKWRSPRRIDRRASLSPDQAARHDPRGPPIGESKCRLCDTASPYSALLAPDGRRRMLAAETHAMTHSVDREQVRALIAVRAYEIWENEGRPHGRDALHWKRAEQEILASIRDSAGVGAHADHWGSRSGVDGRQKR